MNSPLENASAISPHPKLDYPQQHKQNIYAHSQNTCTLTPSQYTFANKISAQALNLYAENSIKFC